MREVRRAPPAPSRERKAQERAKRKRGPCAAGGGERESRARSRVSCLLLDTRRHTHLCSSGLDREGKLSTGGLRAWWEGGPPWSLFTCDPSTPIPNLGGTLRFEVWLDSIPHENLAFSNLDLPGFPLPLSGADLEARKSKSQYHMQGSVFSTGVAQP